jgi:FkbM family methyltransferase
MLKQAFKSAVNSSLRPLGLEVRKWRKSVNQDRYAQCLAAALDGIAQPLVIDIGANVGQSSVEIKKRFPKARILAFEPTGKTFAILQDCATRHGFEAFKLAMGDAKGELEFNCFESSQCNSILAAAAPDHAVIAGIREKPTLERVRVETLDSFLDEHGLGATTVNYLKIDVQGFEMPVLLGAKQTLTRTQSILIEVSFCRAYQGQCLVDEVCHCLRSHGFSLCITIGYLPGEDVDELVSSDFFFSRFDKL